MSDHEGKERGRTEQEPQSQSGRPTGTSNAEDFTGVDPQESQSTIMQPGDQGG
jgi:hypothetical protein